MLRFWEIAWCIIVLVFCIFIMATRAQAPTYRATVKQHDTFDFKGIITFDLQLADHTTVLIMGDGDLPIIKQLVGMDKRRVRITIEEDGLQEIAR